MVPSHWPVLGNIRYESPPPCRSHGPNEDDGLEPEQRAAKRRRIEQNATDYLRGKDLYISSAVLKGTFASNSVNPWKRKSREIDVQNSDEYGEHLEDDRGRRRLLSFEGDFEEGHVPQKLKRRTVNGHGLERSVLETEDNTRLERPTSRASAGYCAEWLQRQNTRNQTPTIDSDEEYDRPRRRTSITTAKSPTQRALSRKLARNNSPLKARHAMSPRKERSSPNRPQSPSIELHRYRVTTVQQDYSAVSRLPESMEVTAGSSALHHLESPEDRTTTTNQLERHRVLMPLSFHTGFTAINSPTKDDATMIPDSARGEAEYQLPARNFHKSRHEVLRSAEKIAKRPVSLGAKGPLAAINNSRHPYIASPAVANGSPGFPYRRISDGNKVSVSVPVSKQIMIKTISHGKVQENRAKPSRLDFSAIENNRLEQDSFQHGGTESSIVEKGHGAGRSDVQNGATKGRARENRTEQSPIAIMEPDSVIGNGDPAYEDLIEDVELNDATPDAPLERPVGIIPSRSGPKNTAIKEVRIVEPSAEDINLNGNMANWRCPVTSCPRVFNTRGGLASHITRGHKLQVAKDKPKGASKRVKPAGPGSKRRKGQEDVDVSGSIYDPMLKNAPKEKQATHHFPAPQLQEPSLAPQSPEPSSPPRQPDPAPAARLPEPYPAPQLSYLAPASVLSPPSPAPQLPELNFELPDAANGDETMPSPEVVSVASPKGNIEIEMGFQDANTDEEFRTDHGRIEPHVVMDEETIVDPSPPPVQHVEGSREKSNNNSVLAKCETNTVVSGTTIPDHQDSGAYSTFTFNPEQSTQAALLQAQLAFQETQANDQDSDADELDATTPLREKNSYEAVSKSAYPLGAVTPFREVNSRFSAPAAPTPVFPVLSAATQDLEAAAAGVMFSTVKKPRTKKRISFENWPTTKPSKDLIAKAPTKGVEWSPLANETPVLQNSYVASPFATNGADESEIGRNESLPVEREHEEITVLEAASSTLLMKTPKTNSFAAATPGFFLEAFSTRTDSFSPRPMEMSSAFSSGRRGSQSPSGPSDLPVPSFQEGQGMLAELNSQDIDAILDDTNHLLGSWDPEQGEKSYIVAASVPAN